ncbi:hypothetical protein RhiirC2_804992 [Rhizophagus irregularis]|uniref:Uncharacterized protein n=1 Tax=Rhizophagus irregularis TaxID=588596 RepID=A0A2N1KVU3_9GLOM|nr:hypothetical protein RhiirC2_804992 [Rhizophagus irregularis]
MNQTPALENDGAVLNMLNDSRKFSPCNDQDLREMLRVHVKNCFPVQGSSQGRTGEVNRREKWTWKS